MESRRKFIAAAGLAAVPADAQSSRVPVIDTHIHLFDQTRPQGVPYSGGGRNQEPSLPPRYRKLARPLGVVGAIHLEASPWIEDNLWVLQVAQSDPIMVGVVGNLEPDKPEFKEYLDRHAKNKLFLGIRYGNIWGRDLARQVNNPVFIEGMKLVEQAGLVMDSANPTPSLVEAILRLSERIPGLRIVVDHLPGMFFRLKPAERPASDQLLRELAARPNVFIKVSAALREENGRAVTDAAVYKPVFDFIFDTFGEDRLIYGSDWPNSIAVDNYPNILKIVRDYFGTKSPAAQEKYFWRNSAKVYKWIPRAADQPRA